MIDFADLYKRAEISLCYVVDNCTSYIEINLSLAFKQIALDVDSFQMRLSKRLLYLTLNVNIARMHVQSVLAMKINK